MRDITNKKTIEHAIIESEEKFRRIIEQTVNGVTLIDKNGVIVEYNNAEAKITGYGRDEIIGTYAWDFLAMIRPGEKSDSKSGLNLKASFLSLIKYGEAPFANKFHEIEIQRPNGGHRMIRAIVFPIKMSIGFMICAITYDITEQKKIELEIKESEQKFRSIIEQSTDGFILTDEEGRIIEFNKGMETISGHTREDNLYNYLWDSEFFKEIISKTNNKRPVHVKEIIEKFLKTGKSSILSRIIESDITRKDRTIITLQVVVFPIKTEKGYKLSGIARDITERKKIENELKESEEKFRSLAETMTNGIIILQNGHIVYDNPAVEHITGYTIADVSRSSLSRMAAPEYTDLVNKAENEFHQGSIPDMNGHKELKILNKSGDFIWLEFTIGKLNYQGKPAIIITFFDVTQRKTMEEELQKAHDDLEQRVRERTHELELANKSLHSEIEQRIISENALQASENRYKYLVENIDDIICETDRDNRFVYVSPRVRDILGYGPEELLNKTPYAIMREDEQKRIISIFENNVRNNEPLALSELYMTHKDGRQIPMELSVRQIVDGDGNTIGYNGIVRDLTQRKMEEQKLLQSTTDLQAVFKAFPDLFFRLGADGTILSFNGPRLYLGLEDLPGKKMQDILPKEYHTIVNESIRSVNENKSMVIFEYILSVNGKSESFEARLLPAISDQIIMIVRNITSRKAIEDELRGSEEKFRNLVEKIDDLVWEINERLVFTYISPKVKTLLGYSPSEVIGRKVTEFMSDDEARHVKSKIRPLLEERQPFSVFENVLIHKAGHEVIMEVSGAPIFDSNGDLKGYRGVDRDVTSKRKADELLRWNLAFTRTMADNSPLALYAVDGRDDRILYYNDRFIEIANLSEIEDRIAEGKIKHDEIVSYVLPRFENSKVFKNSYERLHNEVNTEIAEEEVIDKDGRSIRCFSSQIRDDNNIYLGRLYLFEDITDRKSAENALWENQRFLTILIGNLPGMVYRCYNNEDWTMDYVSEGSYALTGYRPKDLVASKSVTYNNIVHVDDRERIRNEVEAALSQGMPFTIEYRIITASGETKWVWEQGCESSPMESGEKMIEGFVTDITTRKLFEEKIASLASFPELDPNPVIEVNAKEQIIYMNKSAKETFPGLAPGHPIVAGLKPVYNEFKNGGLRSYSREVKLDAAIYSQFIYYVPEQELLRIYAADITKGKQAEDELKIVNRALRMVNDCNQTLVRAVNEKQLLEDVCRIIVEKGGYRLAWVGFISKDRPELVVPAVKMGFDNGYVDGINIVLNDTERGSGPTGAAIKSGQPAIARYTATDLSFAPWREEALKRGYASTVSLPLRSKGSSIGCLNIYSTKADAFDEAELKLLMELADDLTYGLMSIRASVEREKAEETLQLMKFTIDFMEGAAYWVGEDSRFYYVSESTCRELGYTREEMLGMSIADIDLTFKIENWPKRWEQIKSAGNSKINAVHKRKDGSIYPVEISSKYIDFNGRQYDFAFSRRLEDTTAEEVMKYREKLGV
ncbi:MAG TPA: PAS domain S-box protein [Methanocellaceae archaeon]